MSNVLIHPERLSGTASSGSLVVNTRKLNGLLRQVVINPATESTIYDVKIVNSQSNNIYERTSQTGCLAEEVSLPFYGIHTLTISNATVDELIEIQLILDY